MFEEKIKVNKKRDFSDVLNASFGFIKQEYKTMWRMLFLYAGIPVLIYAILTTIYVQNPISNIIKVFTDPGSAQNLNDGMQGKALIFNLFSGVVNIFLTGLTYCYIVVYAEKKSENIDIKEVWHKFTTLFASLVGYNILTGIILIFSFIALIIPGIYVMVPLSFILIIKVAENNSFGKTFERCFFLIKHHWWESLGLIIISGIVVMMMSSIFSIPAGSYTLAKGLLSAEPTFETIPFVITSFFSTIGTALITPLPAIVITFQYYSLVEQKDNLSLLNKIDQINEQPKSDNE